MEVVQALIAAKADLDKQDEVGRTALIIACKHAENENEWPIRPIWPNMEGRVKVVQALIDAKADLDKQDQEGGTALTLATDPRVISILKNAATNRL